MSMENFRHVKYPVDSGHLQSSPGPMMPSANLGLTPLPRYRHPPDRRSGGQYTMSVVQSSDTFGHSRRTPGGNVIS